MILKTELRLRTLPIVLKDYARIARLVLDLFNK